MARQERNDVDYFPHLRSSGKCMYYLDTNYGNDGYSVWFRTLERLCKDYHYLDLNDESELMYIASKCKVNEDRYIEIIEVLVKFGEFDHFLWHEHKILWNEKFIESIKDAYRKRSNECINRDGLLKKLGIKEEETPKTIESSGVIGHNGGKLRQKPTKDRIGKDRIEEDRKGKDMGGGPVGPPEVREFYSKEFQKTKGQPLREKYFFIIEYIYNLKPNVIGEPGIHILKLKKQLSFDEFQKLHDFVSKRPSTSIKSMIDSWLNNPKYSKDRISVYAVLRKWAEKEPIQGTNLSSSAPSTPLVKTTIGQSR